MVTAIKYRLARSLSDIEAFNGWVASQYIQPLGPNQPLPSRNSHSERCDPRNRSCRSAVLDRVRSVRPPRPALPHATPSAASIGREHTPQPRAFRPTASPPTQRKLPRRGHFSQPCLGKSVVSYHQVLGDFCADSHGRGKYFLSRCHSRNGLNP